MAVICSDQPPSKLVAKCPMRSGAKLSWSRELERDLDGDLPMREAVGHAAAELRLSTCQTYKHLTRVSRGAS